MAEGRHITILTDNNVVNEAKVIYSVHATSCNRLCSSSGSQDQLIKGFIMDNGCVYLSVCACAVHTGPVDRKITAF